MKTKKVFTDISHIAHLWANQLQDEAINSGNFYFNGKTIYSYGNHFPIAVISEDNKTVFFTTRTYSNTTANHISVVRQACSQFDKIYCKNPDQAVRNIIHSENLESFEDKAKEISLKLARANKPEKYLVQIAEQRSLLEKYCIYFSLSYSFGLYPFTEIKSKTGASEATDKENKAIELRQLAAAKQDLKDAKIERKKFYAFEIDRCYKSLNYKKTNEGLSYLRYNTETKRIETSQRIEIPVEAAKRFYRWMQKNVCTECTHKFLDYEVKDINKDTFRIGCHLIERSEADKISKLLNW